jgi:hypothetical protein
VLYRNYRYGDPSLKSINTFLFAAFITRVLMFFVIVGSIQFDLVAFAGYLGISVALNRGVAVRPPKTEPARQTARELLPPLRSALRT